jgi:basic membrane protein A and related proteins
VVAKAVLGMAVLALGGACPRSGAADAGSELLIGLVTDTGGRGDMSFNDSALQGLEVWAAGRRFRHGLLEPVSEAERAASIPGALASRLTRLPVRPLVLQSRAQEDYPPNVQLLVDEGVALTVAVGFMLEKAVRLASLQSPRARFLLIDSPLLDEQGRVVQRPNVRTVVFREHEGSFLAGALAGLVAPGAVGFVGGMEIPLIQRFEAGFQAGLATTHPEARLLVQYTGSFDNVLAGKQAAQDLLQKGATVLFHAAGADGVGVIQAVKEARTAGKAAYVIGVDSDQSHLAPDAVLTSMVKRVDLAVWMALDELVRGRFTPGDVSLGLAEGGVDLAPVRLPLPDKEATLARVEALRAQVVSGALQVPTVPR